MAALFSKVFVAMFLVVCLASFACTHPAGGPGEVVNGGTNIKIRSPVASIEEENSVMLSGSVPSQILGPNGRPIQIIPSGVGATPGTVTGSDGNIIYIVLPSEGGTTPPGSTSGSTPRSTPGTVTGPDGCPVYIMYSGGGGTTPSG